MKFGHGIGSVCGGVLAVGAVATVAALGACAPADAQTSDMLAGVSASCNVAAIQAMAPADTTITAAQALATPVPHCRIDGYVTTTNPGPNKNLFRLQLPAKDLWKSRYYFIGLGAAGGYVPTDSQIPGGNPMVKGFAVAGADTGHEAPMADYSFLTDPAKALDHIDRGSHLVAVATQQITRTYYGVEKMYRYHSGCSGGGRMGGEAMMKHPSDYDGILFGVSGLPSAARHLPPFGPFPAIVRELGREPGSWVSPDKFKMVDAAVTAACDDTDGAHDGVVWDHRLCHYDVAQLKCKAGDAPDCLTQPEITTIKNLLRDTRMPITNISVWSVFFGQVPPPWSPDPSPANRAKTAAAFVLLNTWAASYLHQPGRDVMKDPLTPRDLAAMDAEQTRIGYFHPYEPTTFLPLEKSGDKVLFWGGVSDPCCSNINFEELLADAAKVMGGDPARVAKFAQYYEIPGMGHCGGGTGPGDAPDRLLDTLINWVEKGEPPAPVVMHRGADRVQLQFAASGPNESGVLVAPPVGVSRDFLVCPYPLVSVFDKTKAGVPGAVYDAANWSCRTSR